MNASKPRIAAIGTGGSISAVGRDSLDLFDYGSTGIRVEPQELLDRVPEVATVAEVVTLGWNLGETQGTCSGTGLRLL